MRVSNRWNQIRYRLYAPVYDWVAKPLEGGRKRAVERLDLQTGEKVLLLGSGTGMDLEYFPPGVEATAIDVTSAMARRTVARANQLELTVHTQTGDARSLPFEDDVFDAVTLHLILSVVPDPDEVVAEAERVLDTHGRISIYDKFISEDSSPSIGRRAVNPIAELLFADLNRRLEPMFAGTELTIGDREQFLQGLYTVTIARPSSV